MDDPAQKTTVVKREFFAKSKIISKSHSVIRKQQSLQRQDSLRAIEELVQCGICLEKLTDPRMLPCQHTFCLTCLHSHLTAYQLFLKQKTVVTQSGPNVKSAAFKCPMCQKVVDLEKGAESLNDLPKNLSIQSVLKVIDGNTSPIKTNPDFQCVKCHIVTEQERQYCQHCLQIFCNVCWNEHLSELESNLAVLAKQVNESKLRLDHKLESFENRCSQLVESIKASTVQKIELLKIDEEKVLKDVELIVKEGKGNYNKINDNIETLKKKLSSNSLKNNPGKVFSFITLHKETSRLLNSVTSFGDARVIFDPESFKLDQATEGTYNVAEDEIVNSSHGTNSLERFESASQYYKTRSYIPKLVWNRCPRPSNVAVPPWDNRLLYIAATDTHSVLILNRDRRKLEGRLTSSEMLYPQGIAFSKTHEEIYISDKWKHCIHVFTKNGDYSRDILSKGNGIGKVRTPDGIAMGPNEELVICDSGNDRIIIINPRTGEHLSTIGIIENKTIFNMPTGITVHGDKIFVADTGNHRIKIFDMDGRKIHEFGGLGRSRGQFRSVEVVAVDQSGFIFVGDSGNARVQIFKPDGTVAKIFSVLTKENDNSGWVSGICVTPEFDIVVADSKRRCLMIF